MYNYLVVIAERLVRLSRVGIKACFGVRTIQSGVNNSISFCTQRLYLVSISLRQALNGRLVC